MFFYHLLHCHYYFCSALFDKSGPNDDEDYEYVRVEGLDSYGVFCLLVLITFFTVML